MGDYIPSAPIDDEARKRNGNLPGMGGVFNYVNMNVYHYSANNPIKYVDPNGEWGENVHYGYTKNWAMRSICGFSEKAANILANANKDVDSGETDPVSGDQSWHFNTNNKELGSTVGRAINNVLRSFGINKSTTDTSQDSRVEHAEEQMAKAIKLFSSDKEAALKELGKGLHALQDIDAHSDKNVGVFGIGGTKASRWSHFGGPLGSVPLSGYTADRIKSNRSALDNTFKRTIEYIERFKKATGFDGEL
jgi:hypothetical protein